MKINDLSSAINDILSEYAEGVAEGMDGIRDSVAKDGSKRLKNISPKLTGDYRKGWRVKKDGSKRIIHNSTNYQLTHLLENGHMNRDGSRTAGIPHISIVEEEVIKDYVEQVEDLIKRGV